MKSEEAWRPLVGELPPPARGEVHLVRARIAHAGADEAHEAFFRGALTGAEKARADRLIDPRRAREWSAARASLRHILAAAVGGACDPLSLRFSAGPHKKPHLITDPSGAAHHLRFNLSHSGVWALVAITSQDELGVDVEYRDLDRPTPALARYAFSRDEYARWEALCEEEQKLAFYRLWTRKEAYIKALGMGLHLDLKSFDLSHEEDAPRLLEARHEGAPEAIAFESFMVDGRHQGALAICRDALERISSWEWSPGSDDE